MQALPKHQEFKHGEWISAYQRQDWLHFTADTFLPDKKGSCWGGE